MNPASTASALFAAALFLVHAGAALAVTCQSNANGNWNATATWTGCTGGNGTPANTPGSNDDVQIRNANTVTIPAGLAAAARSVTFTASSGAANLTHAAATSALTVGVGGVTMNPSGNNNPKRWNINAGSATVNGTVTLNGTSTNNRPVQVFITTGTLDINGNLSMNAGNAVRAVIDMSGGAGNLFIAGSFTFASTAGTLTPGTTSTVTFDSATTPVTVQTGSSVAYNDLVIAKGLGNVANAAATGNLVVGRNLTVTSGTFNIPGINSTVSGATSVSGTLGITSATGTKTFSGAVTVNSGGTWSNTGNASVTMGAGLSNSGTFGAGNGTYTLTGDLTNSNSFNAGTGTFSLTGNFTNNGTFSASTGTFTFNGGAAQTLTGTASGATTFANLTLNNASGLTLTGTTHDVTVSTLLTLTNGTVTTGANVLYVSNGSNIAGAGGTRFVIGNLKKAVPTGASNRVFEIGAGANYLPVTLVFASVGTGGDLTVTTTGAEHPNILTSGLDDTLDVNRYWTLVSPTIASVNYTATFNWVAADLDAGADTTIFEAQRYSPAAPAAGTWNGTTESARTPTSNTLSGVTGFGDFAIGQPLTAVSGIGRFNAYDTGTAAGATTGFITTKVAGTSFSVAVIALANNRKSINTGYKGTVQMTLLNASDNSGTLDSTTNCNTSWTQIQPLPDLVFDGSENGRKNATITENDAWRQVRIRMVDGGLVGCSTDAFAIRPSNFTVSITDADWSTAGTSRVLNNTSATGGNVHKAGRPFTITVTPGSSSNYDGDPTVAVAGGLSCTLPVSCTNGTLSLGAFTGSGNRVSNTATYAEAGAFSLTLEDQVFAVIDATDGTPADCSASGRFICQASAPLAVGRFVPDRFEFASPSAPSLLTFNDAACGTRSFTYVGQPFWYVTGGRPSATVNAVEAGGAVTTNYSLDPGSSRPAISESYADAGAPAAAPLNAASIGTPSLSGSGTGTYMASLTGQLSYTRSTTTPVGPFTAAISLTVTASDSTDSAVTGNGTITTPTPLVFDGGGTGIAFDSGAQFRFGRLRLGNANGSQLVPLLVPLEVQYYSGPPANAFLANTADSCIAIAATNIELDAYTGNLGLSVCPTSLSLGAFSKGRATVLMSAPGVGNSGGVRLTARLESSVSGANTCIGGTLTTVGGANRAYLQGNWTAPSFTENPSARATFGAYRGSGDVIDFRENY